MNTIKELEISLKENEPKEDEENYDHPNNSIWVIGVDFRGQIFIIEPPNIHPSFLEYNSADEIGLVAELPEEAPGIYKMVCTYEESRDWESGLVEEYRFLCEKLEPMYTSLISIPATEPIL